MRRLQFIGLLRLISGQYLTSLDMISCRISVIENPSLGTRMSLSLRYGSCKWHTNGGEDPSQQLVGSSVVPFSFIPLAGLVWVIDFTLLQL